MKFFIILISTIIFFSFSSPSYSQDKSLDTQIEILNLKLEVVKLKKIVFLNKVQLSNYFTQLRIEEDDLVYKIAKLTDLKKKQETEKDKEKRE